MTLLTAQRHIAGRGMTQGLQFQLQHGLLSAAFNTKIDTIRLIKNLTAGNASSSSSV